MLVCQCHHFAEALGSAQAAQEREALEQLAQRHRGLFTYQALWSSMPLDLYCQCIGTSNSHPHVQQLILQAPRMGDSPPKVALSKSLAAYG